MAAEDFQHFVLNKDSLTVATAQRLAVAPQRFCDWRWQMKNQITTAGAAARLVALDRAERAAFADKTLARLFNVAITPYALGLMRREHSPQHPCPVRLQLLPRQAELHDREGQDDPLHEKPHSPVPEVVHVYPDRVAFCVAQLCPIYCRFCFRKRRDAEQGLHFNRSIIARGLAYIRANPQIKDVLLTGGDPLIASDKTLDALLHAVRAIPHVEIIRIGTRTPVTLPYRVTTELAAMLAKYHPLWINTHFNCAEELTAEACHAVAILLRHGIPLGNQTVLLKGVNDSVVKMQRLLRALVRARIRPYYLFHPHLVSGTAHLRLPLHVGLRIMRALQGRISGFALPRYMLDTAAGKIPLQHQYLLQHDEQHALVENMHGELWREQLA